MCSLDALAERDLEGPLAAVAWKFGATLEEALGRRRLGHIVAARHACWAHLRALGWSYPAIAELWGVDHTSVMYGVKK